MPRSARDDQPQLSATGIQLTPMIDIVFQLLVFFILTFKIVSQEGDFNVQMPAAGDGVDSRFDSAQLHVRLTADDRGGLARVTVNDVMQIESWDALRDLVASVIEQGGAEEVAPIVVFQCDYGLKYEHAMDAITAVSGYRDGDEIIPLAENIRFVPQSP